MQNLFIDLLTEQGYEVITAKNGLEAIEKARETDFAIAFIDVHMPVMNGVEALKEIRKIRPKIVAVMTDSFPDSLIEQSKKEGSITCLRKPFDIREVFKVLDKFVGPAEKT